ncbi:uncharacterized protein MELLADRAFT_91894 [Melampsora larici-populina 98AG31]|uniref:Uncharacterized protein n=1 Tax=Melampsora larici-populina (strain 98AG31 / pathotype 3-4-7) TaxID=747676 RepID=F4S0R5_MELLP|nr:uncharacterized protein MELLADRAFT_91894 [Melampsora larici-populina 98AG31]EGG01809.1 hypothetical protein MELLADRAFT_91894 [Melampsora larici-populina 98AG31]
MGQSAVSNGGNSYKNRCGKPYEPSAPALTIQGQFPSPQMSRGRRLEFGCTPAIQPYISTDNESTIYMVVDAVLTQYETTRSIEISPETSELQVVVINTNTSKAVASGMVKVHTLGNQMKFSFKDLGEPSMKAYNLICQAYVNEQWITEASTSVKYLPSNLQKGIASVVRMNAESGTLMVTDEGGEMMPFIPFGFFATYENYLDSPNLSQIILDMQSRGIGQFQNSEAELTRAEHYSIAISVNTVQPVVREPSVTDLGKLASVLSNFSRAGMWIQYDMTRSFKNTKHFFLD